MKPNAIREETLVRRIGILLPTPFLSLSIFGEIVQGNSKRNLTVRRPPYFLKYIVVVHEHHESQGNL